MIHVFVYLILGVIVAFVVLLAVSGAILALGAFLYLIFAPILALLGIIPRK